MGSIQVRKIFEMAVIRWSRNYVIYRADNMNANIPVFIYWILPEERQTLIEESGYVRKK